MKSLLRKLLLLIGTAGFTATVALAQTSGTNLSPGTVTIDGPRTSVSGASILVDGFLSAGAGRPVEVYVDGAPQAYVLTDSRGGYRTRVTLPFGLSAGERITIMARSNGWITSTGTQISPDSDTHIVRVVPPVSPPSIRLQPVYPTTVKVNEPFVVAGVFTTSNPKDVPPGGRELTILQGSVVLADGVVTDKNGRFSAEVRLTEGMNEDRGPLPLSVVFDGSEYLSPCVAYTQIGVTPRAVLTLPAYTANPQTAKIGQWVTLAGTAKTSGVSKRLTIEFYIQNELVDRVAVTPTAAGAPWNTRFILPKGTPPGSVAIVARYRGDTDYRRLKDTVRITVAP